MRRFFAGVLRVTLTTLLAVVLILLFFQNKLIYHPRSYAGDELSQNPAVIPLTYSTSQGRQQSYYLPPRNLPLRRLWVVFPGNGSLALDWLGFLTPPADPNDGYLLVEYPGYGVSQGFASPEHIQESAEDAYRTLAGTLHTETDTLDGNIGVLALSIGCATGLNFATHHPVQRVILVAPFTCMRDMARRVVGWPLCWLLLHNYDNRARLAELAARAHRPVVTIFHGDADTTIPIAMGKSLAAAQPDMITFYTVPGASHNTVLFDAQAEIASLLRQ